MRSVALVSGALFLLTFGGCREGTERGSATPTVTATPTVVTEPVVVPGECLICHTREYVDQQRLTPAQWTATVNKMIGWGAPITAAQGEALAKVLAAAYPAHRPDEPRPLVPAPGVGP